LDEQKLGSSALADEDARLRLGRIAGAQQMVFGSIMRIGEITRVDVRLVSVASSRVLAAHEMIGSAQDLVATMQSVARELVSSLLGGKVVEREGRAAAATADTLEHFDTALSLMDRKDFVAALDALQKILQTDPGFTPAERQIAIALEQISRQ
jgi:curli biogenesis system outer membrane secretion channel CsgG